MAVNSNSNRNHLSWSDEIGLLPLFITLVLPLVIGVIVILKCVYNHCCLRKTTSKSYTPKPTLKSWRGQNTEVEQDLEYQGPQSQSNSATTNQNDAGPSTSAVPSGSVPSCNPTSGLSEAVGGEIVVEDENRPIPPRRSSSGQWRRSILTQSQQNSTNDNQINFSGDSQDCRGYTRISVREPLSNIRNEGTRRSGDPHYATVSDDTDEMYAAVGDGDENYMSIPEDSRHWQERREANSPLPPVPPPISPVLLSSHSEGITTNLATSLAAAASDPISPILPPIYAQVTKVKKTKGPLTTTPSLPGSSTSASTSSQAASLPPFLPELPHEVPLPVPLSTSSTKTKTRLHNHVSLNLDSDASSSSDAGRRWSKADINYSDFEVIREPPFSLFPKGSPSASSPSACVLDEDNYNIVQEVMTTSRASSRRRPQSAMLNSNRTLPHHLSTTSSDHHHHPYSEIKPKPPPHPSIEHTGHRASALPSALASGTTSGSTSASGLASGSGFSKPGDDGYSKITKKATTAPAPSILIQESHLHHPYSKIKGGSPPTGYYQEIGDRKPKKKNNLYQKIRRKGQAEIQDQADESEDEDEDEEDQFYEKVKSKAPPPPPPPLQLDLPNHANPSALKHGYEKIKPKSTTTTTAQAHACSVVSEGSFQVGKVTQAESDEDGSLYEQVKYTPYERLKESEDDLDDDGGQDGREDNLYEDISYSRINKETRPKSGDTSESLRNCGGAVGESSPPAPLSAPAPAPAPVDVDNLYARVDVSKKKRKEINSIVP